MELSACETMCEVVAVVWDRTDGEGQVDVRVGDVELALGRDIAGSM